MTRLAIIFSLLFATPAWAGEVDGNSFLCTEKSGRHTAISFQNGQAEIWIDDFYPRTYQYRATNEKVSWYDDYYEHTISRKTLKIKSIRKRNSEVVNTANCKIMELSKAIEIMVEEEKQRNLRERKGNQF